MAGKTIAAGSTVSNGYTITTPAFTLTNLGVVSGSLVEGVFAPATVINNSTTTTITGVVLLNSGRITAPTAQSGSQAVRLLLGGKVTNNVGGLISASSGIYTSGAPATVANYGTVTGVSGIGISLNAGGTLVNGNASSPSARIGGGAYGVKIAGGTGVVTNHAYITGSTGGVFMAGPGSVYNAGSASGTPGTISAFYAVALTNTSGIGVAASLTNAGLIAGGNLGIGLAGGSVVNDAGGRITASRYAIQDNNAAAVISNLAGGTISGGTNAPFEAIQFKTAAGTVNNYGTINAPAAGTAIAFAYGYSNTLTVGPSASFTGKVDGGNFIGSRYPSLLRLAGSAASTLTGLGTQFVDFNTIDATGTWVLAASDTVAAGYLLEDEGSLTNNGRVFVTPTVGAGAYLGNGGGAAITGASYGVIGLGQNRLVNNGAITQTSNGQSGTYVAVTFKSGGTVTNQAAGVISGEHALGISGAGSLVNMGQITGTNFGFGVKLGAGGSVTNNSGTITGQQGVFIQGGAGTVTNFATIATTSPFGGDSVVLSAGFTNRVKFAPGATFAGGIVDGGNTIGASSISTLELLSANAAGTIAPGTISNLGSSYVNFGSITVDPSATWTMAAGGTVASGVTLTDDGSLTNKGLLQTTPTLAASGARLVNYSTIHAYNGTGGVRGTAAASITNKAGGTIKGSTAITFTGGAATIVNAGLMANVAVFDRAIALMAGGTISNLGGMIYGGYSGILISGGAGTVTNTGKISGAGDQALTLPAQFTNRVALGVGGLFDGSVDGGNLIGINSSVSTLELMSGSSAGKLSGPLGSRYVNFEALVIDASATWTVSGNLAGAYATFVNYTPGETGSAGSAAASVLAGGSLINQGNLSGGTASGPGFDKYLTGLMGGAGVALYSGAMLTNLGVVTGGPGAHGSQDDGVGGNGGIGGPGAYATATARLDNFGVIQGGPGGAVGGGDVAGGNPGAVGPGVLFHNGGTITNEAGATISGTYGVSISGGPGSVTNLNGITGTSKAVVLASGFINTMAIAPGANISGTGDGGNTAGSPGAFSTLRLLSGGSKGVLAGPLGAQYVNFNAIAVDAGATWTISGGLTGATGNYGGGVFKSPGSQGGAGVSLALNAALTNLGTVQGGAGGDGITPGFLQNYKGPGGVGGNAVYAAAAATIDNSGSLLGGVGGTGSVAGAIGTAVRFKAGGTVTAEVGGTISGTTAIDFGTGSSRLVFVPGAVFIGQVNGGSGADRQLELAKGSASGPAAGTLSGVGANYVNFNHFVVDTGASWTVTGTIAANSTVTDNGRLINNGDMLSTPTLASAGASLTNASSATISGGAAAGVSAPAAATVVNYGRIAAIGYGIGVDLRAGGVVTNRSGAIIGPGSDLGVSIKGGAGTVANFAVIAATYGSGTIDAVKLAAGYTNKVAVAPGAVFTGLVDGGNTTASGTSISTLELMSANAAGVIAPGTATGIGMQYVNFQNFVIDPGASWTTTGTIAVGATLTDDGALINGGVVLTTATLAGSGAILTNASGATINASGGAVLGLAGSGPVVNYGVLTDGSNIAPVISLIGLSGLAETVTNAAKGQITGGNGIRITGSAGTVVNGGSIAATGAGYSVYLANGFANRVIVNPGGAFTGEVNGGNTIGAATVSTLELGAGAGQGTLSGLGAQFVNFASVTVDGGGTWSLAGANSLTAGARLNNLGSLSVDGEFLVDGTWTQTTNQLTVGEFGDGRMVVENAGSLLPGGAATANSGLMVGQSAGRTGDVVVTGALSLLSNAGSFVVGDAAQGSLEIQAAGTVSTTPTLGALGVGLVIANSAAATGSSVSLTGGGSNLQVTGALDVGFGGAGGLSLTGGTSVTANGLDAGGLAASSGQVSLSDAGTTLGISGALDVGDAGFGQMSIAQSAKVSAASAMVANASGADGAITVTGVGSALKIAGLLTVGGGSSGSLNIVNGASVTVGGLTIGTAASGSGNVVIGPGSHLTLTSTTINVGLAGSAVLDIQGGTLGLVSGTTLSPGTFGRIVQVGGLIDPASVLDASGGSFGGGGTAEASGTIVNSSLASVSGGAETLLAPLITSSDPVNVAGVWSIKNSGTLVLDVNTIDNSQTISFGDLTGVLTIGQQVTLDPMQTPQTIAASALGGFAAPIVGFKAGDKITFAGLSYGSDTVSGNVVTLWSGKGGTGTNLGSLTFQTGKGTADNTGAAAAAAQIACFAAGTRIETPAGPCAVELLREGDEVVLANGEHQPVVLISKLSVNCRAHPAPEAVWPIRVKAGAFDNNVPARDLYLSPDHAVFVNGVLVPVKLLLNGKTIVQVKRDRVTYFHVQLPEHAVILAEGLTVESYLEVGGRANFRQASGTIRLHPDFAAGLTPETAPMWEACGAAPLVMTGTRLAAVQSWLAGRADLVRPVRRLMRAG